MERLDIEAFLERGRSQPIFDVRTPAEFASGHIPGAYNLPLFSNEERVTIGTLYKRKGRETAILNGLDMVGPKMREYIERVIDIAGPPEDAPNVLVNCWRGGMRSGSMSWLLNFYGYKVATLEGGYKAWRRLAIQTFESPLDIRILAGKTGSGKTDVLHALQERGAQVLDLEGLANHKGSAFGAISEPPQPTEESFQNELARHIRALNPDQPVWIEDESRMVGRIVIPQGLWTQMREAPRYVLDISDDARLDRLVRDYETADAQLLINAFDAIKKRLGSLAHSQGLKALEQGDVREAARLALYYYDKTYLYGLSKHAPEIVHTVTTTSADPGDIANALLSMTA